jgi:hypothetical protein
MWPIFTVNYELSMAEVMKAIGAAKNGKPFGIDELPNEI